MKDTSFDQHATIAFWGLVIAVVPAFLLFMLMDFLSGDWDDSLEGLNVIWFPLSLVFLVLGSIIAGMWARRSAIAATLFFVCPGFYLSLVIATLGIRGFQESPHLLLWLAMGSIPVTYLTWFVGRKETEKNQGTSTPPPPLALRLATWATGILLFYTLASFANLFLCHFNVDFPFFLDHNPTTKTISFRRFSDEKTEGSPRIEFYLDTYYAHGHGAGGRYNRSDTDQLTVKTRAGAIQLKREGETLLVNGKPLPEGQLYKRIRYGLWHPWLAAHLEMKNLGVVTIANVKNSNPRLAIHGRCGTEACYEKGAAITFVLAGLFLFLLRMGYHAKVKKP